MTKNIIPWKKSIFTRLTIAFLLIMIPIYAIGFNLYKWGIDTVRNEISDSMQAQVSFYMNSLETEIQRIQSLQFDCLSDGDLNMLAGASQIMDNYERDQAILRVQNRLNAIKSSSRYILEVSTHIPEMGITINTVDIRDINSESYEMLEKYSDGSSKLIFYWKGKLLVNAVALTASKNGIRIPRIFIEVELSDTKLRNALGSLNISDESGTLLFGNGMNYIITENSSMEKAQSIIGHIQNRHKAKKDNTFSMELNKKKYFTTFSESAYLNLTVVRYIPENVVFKKINLYPMLFWIFSISTLCIIVLFSFYTNRFIHKPLTRLVKAFGRIEKGEFDTDITHKHDDEFRYIYERFNRMVDNLKELIDQVYKQKILVQKAELKQLQSQINPHFLYNSFFILSRRVQYGDTDNAIQFCNQLGSYFQFITRSAADIVTLGKEVEHAQIYADIQASRFSGRINVDFEDLHPDYANMMVPRLILQPIIENAFEYGLEDKEENGQLIVRFFKEASFFNIIVEDNGDMAGEAELENLRRKLVDTQDVMETTGIINIHRRIRLMYGESSGIKITRSQLGGLKITIEIEIEMKEDIADV